MKCSAVRSICATLLWFGMLAGSSFGQLPVRTSSGTSFDRLSKPAGLIFSGTVTQVERLTAANGIPGFVRIHFRVDDAVRGCNSGDEIAISEWAELWVRGDRYRVGQKLFLFLYPPGRMGLTSPVAGDLGRFTIGPDGLLRLTPQQSAFLETQSGVPRTGANAAVAEHSGLRSVPLNAHDVRTLLRESPE